MELLRSLLSKSCLNCVALAYANSHLTLVFSIASSENILSTARRSQSRSDVFVHLILSRQLSVSPHALAKKEFHPGLLSQSGPRAAISFLRLQPKARNFKTKLEQMLGSRNEKSGGRSAMQ